MRLAGCIVTVGLLAAMQSLGADEVDERPAAKATFIQRMRRFFVDSEAISSIGYHKKTSTLEVRFRESSVYRYSGVPPQVFQEFIASESKGHYFQQKIRGHYPYWKMSE